MESHVKATPQKEEKIIHNGSLVAMIVRKRDLEAGAHFFTDDDSALQIGVLVHPKGKVLKAHKHNLVSVNQEAPFQEVLYVESGELKVTFYTDDGKKLGSCVLRQGDIVHLIRGGHGFEMLGDCRLIEIKQGPYTPSSRQDLSVEN